MPPNADPLRPDPEQTAVLEHGTGSLLVTGAPGTGKSAVLRERFARVIEEGADPERVGLVVRTKHARRDTRCLLLERVRASLPGLRVMTVHALAHHVLAQRHEALGYDEPPEVLTAPNQFSIVRELLLGEDPARWPAFGAMLPLRGFADEVRQFLLRAQEALLSPEDIEERAGRAGLTGWVELAEFYRRYLQVLDDQRLVDFAGMVAAAATAAAAAKDGPPLFDHLLVDDYQEATFATEALVLGLSAPSLVVAGDLGSHVFSFQGTTDEPLRRFTERVPTAGTVDLLTRYRSGAERSAAWFAPHSSEEFAGVARELRRTHVREGVPWRELAVVVRRQGPELPALVRALDDARIPRSTPEGGLSLLAEPAVFPFVLAFRWLARPDERDALVESVLTSDLAGLSPAAARGLVRAATARHGRPAAALEQEVALPPSDAADVSALREALSRAEPLAARSVLDAFAELWQGLPYARSLVDEAHRSHEARRGLDAVLALGDAVERAGELGDASVAAFLDALESGAEGPGLPTDGRDDRPDAVRVLTAHGVAGLEFDTVVLVGALEGNFPSLSRLEPMFDLAVLERRISQAERNRLRLEDERRLFRVVTSRARRRVLFTASDPQDPAAPLTARSRFVGETGVGWEPVPQPPEDDPLTVGEASAVWRRRLADTAAPIAARLAAMDGLLALGERPERWWFQRDWTDTGRPLHDEIRTSYSKLDKLENCALQYVLAEELGLDDRAGYHAWVGHTVHRVIEDCEHDLIARDLDSLMKAVEDRWRPQVFPSLAVSEAFRRLVTETMLPRWLEWYGGRNADASEVRFEFDLDRATVRGYIDRIGGLGNAGTLITDYKTGKASDVTHPEENLQLGVYYLAVARAPELAAFRPVRAVELAFLREPPKRDQVSPGPMAIAQLPITRRNREEYEQAVTERVTGLVDRLRGHLETESYAPNPKADCYFCRFKSLCPLWPEGAELFPAEAGAASPGP